MYRRKPVHFFHMKFFIKLFFNFIFWALANNLHAQNACIDSTVTKVIYLPNTSLYQFLKIPCNDDGVLVKIFEQSTQNVQPKMGISKFSKNGIVEWTKMFFILDNNLTFNITHLLQLQNGEYIIGGYITPVFNSNYKPVKILLLKLRTDGSVIWQKQLNNNYGSSTQETVRLTNVQEGQNGDILIFTSDRNGFVTIKNVVTRLNQNGQVVWSNAYFGDAYLIEPSANLSSNNNVLHLWAINFNSPNNCFNSSQLGLCYLQLNYSTGLLNQSKQYCIKPGNTSLNLWGVNALEPGMGHNFISKRLINGNTLVILPDANGRRNLMINLFDSNYHHIKSVLYKTNIPTGAGYLHPYFWFDINKTDGSVVISMSLLPYGGVSFLPFQFYTFIDSDLKLKKQFFIQESSLDSTVGSMSFLNNGEINLMSNIKLATFPGSRQLKFSNFIAGANKDAFCFAKDSTYGTFEPHALYLSSTNFQYDSIKFNVYQSADSNLLYFSALNILNTTTCVKYSICDSLKILGNKIACNLLDSFLYSAYKNPQCLKNIEWSIDTAFADAVKSKDSLKIKFKKTGTTVIYASLAGCTLKDSLVVNITLPKNHCNIETDSLLCPGETKVLKAPKGFAAYRWSNGSNTDSTLAANIGWYYVRATDSCGNSFTDSIQLQKADTSLAFLQNQIICNNDTVMLPIPAYIKSLSWQPQQGISRMGNTILFYPQQTSVYQINAVFNGNCTAQKNIAIAVKHCPQTVFVPNSFTPNNDGLNDRFKPVFGRAVELYYFVVYNRYGQKLFESRNPQLAWDGRYNGIAQQTGSFAWMCRYAFANQPKKLLKGTVILIR